ncbi:MAG: hypothetical protein ACFB5Z_20400 [Elainellaceae cyanobacterium]
MNVTTVLQRALQFVWEGVLRLFSPDDGVYPVVGVQPFEGDPYIDARASRQAL